MNKALVILLISIVNPAFGQKFMNLDFEYEIPGSEMPKNWNLVNSEYEIKLDEKEHVSLKKSLRIQGKNFNTDASGISMAFPTYLVKGKRIEFKGKIKTEGVKNGYAGLFWNVINNDKLIGFDNMQDRGLKDSHDWTEVSIRMSIDTSATLIEFGGLLTGQGTAWFDDFEIRIEGKKFIDLKPRLTEPTKEELSWLKQHIHPLKTYDPYTNFNEDLNVLSKLIGDAKVVALGEVTHGSSEIFKMKHRLIKYLAENEGFDIFSIEANMPEAYKLNEYTINGKGSPTELIKGMYFWTWQTQEVLQMVKWMKEHNLTNKKIHFTGFDMQFYFGAIEELEKSFNDQKSVCNEILALKQNLGSIKTTQHMVLSKEDKEEIDQLISSVSNSIAKSNKLRYEKKWLTQNVRIIEQFLDLSAYSRDKYMAENLLWIKAQNPESKIVIWAHNYHIKKTDMSMGKHLYKTLGTDYLTIGFAFHNGYYTAVGNNGLTRYKAQDSYIGTYENFFNAINEPIFILDLRRMKEKNAKNSDWLLENLAFRNIGALKTENEFSETNLSQDYDLIIFINKSSSSKLLE